MKAKMLWRRTAAMLLTLWIGVFCMAVTASARGNVDTGKEASLSVYFGDGGAGFSDVEFDIYRVANISDTGDYTLTGDFQRYPVSLDNLDSSGWRALAQTLAAYAVRDGLNPLQAKKTGADGQAGFSKLTVGLYLITGDFYEKERTTYTPEPMLISLPSLTEKDEWLYDVEVSCKFDSEIIPAFVERKVQKVWKDDGKEDKRPKQISVQLLENGTVVDTVVLSKENNWEYTWENLDGGSRWQVTEAEVPDGYTVAITQERTVFIMTNTRHSESPPKLPQTGMLWWPVPMLVCCGLLLIVIGLIVRYRHGGNNENER